VASSGNGPERPMHFCRDAANVAAQNYFSFQLTTDEEEVQDASAGVLLSVHPAVAVGVVLDRTPVGGPGRLGPREGEESEHLAYRVRGSPGRRLAPR